jgi:hypothetical protein
MRENRLNITLLVVLHLLIFITPLGVKAFHHHHEHCSGNSGETFYCEHEKPCVICQYEFVTFIVDKAPEYGICLPALQSEDSRVESQVFNSTFVHFSKRAPPLA